MNMWQRQDCHGLDAEVEECCKQRSEKNHLLNSRISIGPWKNAFTVFHLHFSFTTLGWEKVVAAKLLCLFPKIETVWNDPLRRLVKSDQIGRLIFKTFLHGFQGGWKTFAAIFSIFMDWFQDIQRVVERYLQHFSAMNQRWVSKYLKMYLFKTFKIFSSENSTDLSFDVGRSWCAGLAKWWSSACSSWSTSLDFGRRTSPSETSDESVVTDHKEDGWN